MNPIKKRLVYLLALGIIIIFVAYCLVNENQSQLRWERLKGKNLSECVDDDYCLYVAARVRGDPSVCSEIRDEFDANGCFFQIALDTGNLSICENVSAYDENLKNRNKSQGRELCYGSLGGFKNDSAVCDKIKSSADKEMCYTNIAMIRGDIELCDRMQTEYFKKECYHLVAVKLANSSICDWIPYNESENDAYFGSTITISTKDVCFIEVAASSKDESVCDKVISKKPYILDQCYIGAAEAKGDLEVCNKIQNQTEIKGCYSLVSGSTGNISVCALLSDRELRNDCYSGVAKTTENISQCDKIINLNPDEWHTVEGCYSDVGIAKGDETLCYKINSQDERDNCFYGVSQTKNDPTLCSEINDYTRQSECYIDLRIRERERLKT